MSTTSGTLWANVLGRKDNPGRAAVLDGLRTELKRRDGVVLLAPLGFENAYALAMRRERAEALGITTLADLAAKAPQLTMGGDLEFFSRPEWTSVETTYGLRFKTKRQFQPTFMYRALGSGEADVISAFSSDGRIAADDLVVLGDPKGALPPYDAVLLIAPGRAEDRRLREALAGLTALSRWRRCSGPTTRSIGMTARSRRRRRRGRWRRGSGDGVGDHTLACRSRQNGRRDGASVGPPCRPRPISSSKETGMVSPRLTTPSATLVVNLRTLGFSVASRAIRAS
jgi:hypothetical protein